MSLLGFGSPFADIFMAMTMDGLFNDIDDEDELDNDYFSDFTDCEDDY